MNGSVETGFCSICRTMAVVSRTYFYYDIKCECCSGDRHFEIVWTCPNCKPEAPHRISVVMKPRAALAQPSPDGDKA